MDLNKIIEYSKYTLLSIIIILNIFSLMYLSKIGYKNINYTDIDLFGRFTIMVYLLTFWISILYFLYKIYKNKEYINYNIYLYLVILLFLITLISNSIITNIVLKSKKVNSVEIKEKNETINDYNNLNILLKILIKIYIIIIWSSFLFTFYKIFKNNILKNLDRKNKLLTYFLISFTFIISIVLLLKSENA